MQAFLSFRNDFGLTAVYIIKIEYDELHINIICLTMIQKSTYVVDKSDFS